MNLWHISEDSFDPKTLTPKKLHSQETVYTIGNGYFGTRGTFEEGYRKAMPATLLFGVFDDIPVGKEELAIAPDWLVIQLFIRHPHPVRPLGESKWCAPQDYMRTLCQFSR